MEKNEFAISGISALKCMGLNCLKNAKVKKEYRLYLTGSLRSRMADVRSMRSNIHYPPGSFRTINNQLVCCPELAFIQLSKNLTLQEQIFLGMEMCCRINPLTSKEKLIAYANSVPKLEGKKQAMRAINYIIPRSASTAETSVVLTLCLPKSLRGYSLPTPELNVYFEVPKKFRSFAKSDSFYVDIFWRKQKVGLEYDSDQWHGRAGSDKIYYDSARKEILEMMGNKMHTCTIHQLSRHLDMLDLAEVIAKDLKYYKFEFVPRQVIRLPGSF